MQFVFYLRQYYYNIANNLEAFYSKKTGCVEDRIIFFSLNINGFQFFVSDLFSDLFEKLLICDFLL